MKKLWVFIIIFNPIPLVAQDCNCRNLFEYVRKYYEENNPAFQKIYTSKVLFKQYSKDLQKIKVESDTHPSIEECPVYLEKYIRLLKDHHSGIGYNLSRNNFTELQIDSFKTSPTYFTFKKINIDTTELIKELTQKAYNEVEGIYSNGGNIRFGIVKKDGTGNNYNGIVLSQNKFLYVGHILLELKHIEGSTFDCRYNVGLMGFNFQQINKRIQIENGNIPELGFYKIPPAGQITNSVYEFRNLDNQTNYLRLSSFSGELSGELDSFYTAIGKDLKSKPYLIIDLRNNGGGNEQSYFGLMQYIYTNPMEIDPVDVWVSPENIKQYEEVFKGKNDSLLTRMRSAIPFTFIPQITGRGAKWTFDSVTVNPKKIALLFNKSTASAAEGMISYCIQSKKIITIGENSGGYIGYGDVMVKQLPCGKLTLRSSTTKYTNNSKYEFVGIAPTHKISTDSDWIKYALKVLLEKT